MGFIDPMRAEDHAVESICRVLREQGCQIAARTSPTGSEQDESLLHGPCPMPTSVNAVRDLAWTTKVDVVAGKTPVTLREFDRLGRRTLTASIAAACWWGHAAVVRR